MATIPDPSSLPPFLRDSPEDLEAVPLQVSLLTMEIAEHRLRLMALAAGLRDLANLIDPPTMPAEFVLTVEAHDGARGNGHDDDRR